jgi:hypothetical protein
MKEPVGLLRREPAGPPLFQGDPVAIEHRLVDIESAAIAPQNDHVLGNIADDLPYLDLLLPDLLLREFALGNILTGDQHDRLIPPQDSSSGFAHPEHLTIFPDPAELPAHRPAQLLQALLGVSHDVGIFDGDIGHQQSIVIFKGLALPRGTLNRLSHRGYILRVNPFEDPFQRRLLSGRVLEDAKGLRGPEDLICVHSPAEAAGMAEPLRIRQKRFTAAKCLFGSPRRRRPPGLARCNLDARPVTTADAAKKATTAS